MELSWWDKKLETYLRESFDISERMLNIENNESKLRPKKKLIVADLHQNLLIHFTNRNLIIKIITMLDSKKG